MVPLQLAKQDAQHRHPVHPVEDGSLQRRVGPVCVTPQRRLQAGVGGLRQQDGRQLSVQEVSTEADEPDRALSVGGPWQALRMPSDVPVPVRPHKLQASSIGLAWLLAFVYCCAPVRS